MPKKSLLVIGGGAAGFFCAVNAARLNSNLAVTVLEKSNKLLAKVRVSGGGRCNVTHACFYIADMIRKYPRGSMFLKKAFHQFFTTDTVAWFGERGVKLKAEPDGRMFPVTDSSQTIIDCLLKEAETFGVKICTNTSVRSIQYKESGFDIELADSRRLNPDYVCIASGGFPKLSLFEWMAQLEHQIESPVPSLFTFNMPGDPITQLMGVSVPNAQVKISGSKLQESGPLLITHWGMSGPVILRLSAWGARLLAAGILAEEPYHFTILVNWIPSRPEPDLRKDFEQFRFELAPKKMQNKNPLGLPQRLWDYLLQQSGIDENTRWADLRAVAQNKLLRNLSAQEFRVKGKTTFKEEFVTAGGVEPSGIDPNTMQSKKIPNLYFAGEIMDVDGITGGFNFQHAWTSGYIAAKAIASRCPKDI